MRITTLLLCFLLPLFFVNCEDGSRATDTATDTEAESEKSITITPKVLPIGDEPNPAAPGFDQSGSDNKAIMLADSVMKYHGGRKAWDEARFIHWDFFGARTLTWDKHKRRVRIDAPKDNTVYLLDYSGEELTGRIRKLGDEVSDPEALATGLKRAYSMFINDAFWLVHQFKLKDDGVTLKYGGQSQLDPQVGRPSYIIDQTFSGVGDTPGNRYRLFIDKVTYRINTWQFFRDAADTEPAIETPWKGYLPYGDILLSGDRGERFQLTEISVKKKMNERVFSEFE